MNLYDNLNSQKKGNLQDQVRDIRGSQEPAIPTVADRLTTGSSSYAEQKAQLDQYGISNEFSGKELAMITAAMNVSDNPGETAGKFMQALTYSHNKGITFEEAYNNLDALNMAQFNHKVDYTISGWNSVKNSFSIGNLIKERNDLMEEWKNLDINDEDLTDISNQINALDQKIYNLKDDTPSWFGERIAKLIGENWGYMKKGITTSLAAGAIVGISLATAGALPAIIAGTAGAAEFVTLLSAGYSAGTVAGTVVAGADWYQNEAYYKWRQKGASKETSLMAATFGGYIQGGIEAALGEVMKVIGLTGAAKILPSLGDDALRTITNKVATKFAINGGLETLIYTGSKLLLNSTENAAEEVLQGAADNLTSAIVYELDDIKLSDREYENVHELVEEGVAGFFMGLALDIPQLPVNFIKYKNNVDSNASLVQTIKYANYLKSDAKNIDSSVAFVKKHEKDSMLTSDIKESEKKEYLNQIWQNNHKDTDSGMSESEALSYEIDNAINDEFDADKKSTPEEPNEPQTTNILPEPKRLEDGRIRVQESKEVQHNADGTETRVLNMGSTDSTNNYGAIKYTIDSDNQKITIEKVTRTLGHEDLVREGIIELARRNEGWDIEWDPATEKDKAIKDSIINDSVNQNKGKLNWFSSEKDISTDIMVSKEIKKAFKNVTEKESLVMAKLLQYKAEAEGTDLRTWMNNHISGIKANSKLEGRGKIDLDLKSVKGTIYAGKNADFSTLEHEMQHLWAVTDKEASANLAKTLREVCNDPQFKKYLDSHINITQTSSEDMIETLQKIGDDASKWNVNEREATAVLYECYRQNGKTFNEKLKNIFEQIAEFFHRVYKTLKGENMLNDEIVKAYDAYFDKNASFRKAAEKAESKESGSVNLRQKNNEYFEQRYNDLKEKYNKLIINKEEWEDASVKDFVNKNKQLVVNLIEEYPTVDFKGVKMIAGIKTDGEMPYTKELIADKIFQQLVGKELTLLPRFIDSTFNDLFGIKLQEGSAGDAFYLIDKEGTLIDFKLVNNDKIIKEIHDGIKVSDVVFIAVKNDFDPQYFMKNRGKNIGDLTNKSVVIYSLVDDGLYQIKNNGAENSTIKLVAPLTTDSNKRVQGLIVYDTTHLDKEYISELRNVNEDERLNFEEYQKVVEDNFNADTVTLKQSAYHGSDAEFESLRSNIKTYEDLAVMAKKDRPFMIEAINKLASLFGLSEEEVRFRDGIKKEDSAKRKAEGDYKNKGGYSRMKDMVGASFVVDETDLDTLYNKIIESGILNIYESKSPNSKEDYWDYKINYRLPNGTIGELILVDPFVAAMKQTVGHPIYEIRRLLLDASKKENTTEQQRQFLKESYFKLKDLSKEIYTNHTWELDSNSKALSAVITELDSGKELVAGVSTSLDEALSDDNLTSLQPLLVKAFNSKPSSESHRINLESYLSNSERLNIGNASTYNKAQTSESVNNEAITLHQLDKDIDDSYIKEAEEFDTPEEYIEFERSMSFDDSDIPEETLREYWEKAHGVYQAKNNKDFQMDENLNDEQKDNFFKGIMQTDEGIKTFMSRISEALRYKYDVERNGGRIEAYSEEDYNYIMQQIANAERVISEASQFIVRTAQGGNELSDTSIKKIRTTILDSVRDYRDLYAQVIGDDNYAVGVYNSYMPDIQESKAMKITERKNLIKRLEGEEIIDKVRKGTETFDGTAEKVMAVYDKELKELQAKFDKLKANADNNYLKLSVAEREVVDKTEQIKRMESAINRETQSVRAKLDNGIKVSPEQMTKLNSWQDKLNLLHEEIKDLRKQDSVKAQLEKKEALDKLKAEIKQKQTERNAVEEVHNYKRDLLSSIMAPVSNNVDYAYVEKINKLRASLGNIQGYQYDSITIDGKKMTLADFRKGVEDGTIPVDELTSYQLNRYMNTSLADYTIDDLETIKDTVDYFKKMGKQMWQTKVDQRHFEISQMQRQFIADLLKVKAHKADDSLPNSVESQKNKSGVANTLKLGFIKSLNMSRKFQMLSNNTEGAIWQFAVQKKRDLQTEELIAKDSRVNPLEEYRKELGVEWDKAYQTVTVDLSALGYDMQATYTLSDLIYGLMAQKEDRNKQAFMYGDLVSQTEKDQIMNLYHGEANDTSVNKMIEQLGNKRNEIFVAQAKETLKNYPNLMKLAEAYDADFQKQGPRLFKLSVDEYNKPMEQVEHYLPIMRKDFNGTDLAQKLADDIYNRDAGKGQTTPSKGMMKSRIDISPYNQMPTKLDFFNTWYESMNAQEHLIHTLHYSRDLNAVFKGYGGRELRNVIQNTFGDGMLTDIDNYINEISNPNVFTDTQGINGVVKLLRGGLYTGYLGFKASSIVTQGITSPAAFLQYVSPAELTKGILKMTAQPEKTWANICKLSPFMEHRSMDPVIDEISKATEEVGKTTFKKNYNRVMEIGTVGIEAIDKWAVSGGWLACFDKKLAEFENQTDPESIKQAVKFADKVVYETQPLSDMTEIAPIFKSKSEFAKAFTQFQVSLNVIWNNVLYDNGIKAISNLKDKNIDVATKKKIFGKMVGCLGGYAIAGALLTMVKGSGKDDDEKEKGDVVKELIYGMTTQFTSAVPFLSSEVDNLVQGAITGEKGYEYQSSLYPGISKMFSGASTLLTLDKEDSNYQERFKRAMFNLTEGAGLMVGAPVSGIKELGYVFTEDGLRESIINGDPNFTFNPGALLGRR